MTATVFLVLLTIFATATSIATEAMKKFLDELAVNYASNVIVLVAAMFIGCVGTMIYYMNYQIPFTVLNSVYLVLMGVANWIGAMVGYDKVKQAVSQMAGKK